VTLVGAYADNSRTVVIVHVDPARMPELPVTLTDDKGVSLTEPVISPTEKGDIVLIFGAVPNPNPKGNPLTLDIEELGPILTVSGPVTGDYGRVEGQWILHFTIKVDAQAAIPPLAPGQLGQVKVSFQETVVGTDVQVSAHLTGATIGQLENMASDDAVVGPRARHLSPERRVEGPPAGSKYHRQELGRVGTACFGDVPRGLASQRGRPA